MNDPLDERIEDEVARWRASQPPPPTVDLSRMTEQPRPSARPVPARRIGRVRRRLLLAAVLVVTVTVAGGVVAGAPHRRPGGAGPGSALGPVVLAGHVRPVTAGSTTARDLGVAQLAFGFDVLAHTCSTQPDGNAAYSPASLSFALQMLATGASGTTLSRLERLLHLPATGPALLAAEQAQHSALARLSQVAVSNHLYTAPGVHPTPQVLDELATGFGANLRTLDFAQQPERSTEAINRDVARETRGLIAALFDQPLGPDTTTVLTNALHLDAPWQHAFGDSRPAPFTRTDGNTATVQMMDGSEVDGQRRDADGWTSVTLPYTGEQLEAVVLLPPPGAPACTEPTSPQLDRLISGTATTTPVALPELHLTQSHELLDQLSALGLPVSGDYSGFGGGGDLSQVVQKVVLDMDRKGTKGAAASGVAVAASARVSVVVDRPYLLLIRDVTTGAPLFLVRVQDPSQHD